MNRSHLKFDPIREQLMQSLLRLRRTYPDSFPATWASSGKSFKNLSTWKPSLDSREPEAAMEMVCMAHRFWLMMCPPPPTPFMMGPVVNGMILVDMERLGERPPSLASLLGIGEDDWLELEDED